MFVCARRVTTPRVTGHEGCVNRLAWNETGTLLAFVSDDCTCRIWTSAGIICVLCPYMCLICVIICVLLAVMLAVLVPPQSGAPAVLAGALAAVMLADARPPAVLAPAPLTLSLALPAGPLRCAHPLPLPRPLPPAWLTLLLCPITVPLLLRCASLPPVAALAALRLVVQLPVPAPATPSASATRPASSPADNAAFRAVLLRQVHAQSRPRHLRVA